MKESSSMPIDTRDRANALVVVDYWKLPNPKGRATPPPLIDPALNHVYEWDTLYGYILHGTVGTNTLDYWLNGGSMQPGADGTIPWSMAHYLALRDANTIAKMCPDPTPLKRWNCNHVGVSNWYHPALRDRVLGKVFKGIECEDLQNWNRGPNAQRITDDQVVKCALMIAY